VPSSDTHPDILDPAESSTYTARETADSPNHPDPTPPAAGSSSNLGIKLDTGRFPDSAAAAEQMQAAAADRIKSRTTTGDDGLSSEGGLDGEDPQVTSGGSSHTGGSSHSSSERRSHPVARAAGTALGTAAGTVLGAAGKEEWQWLHSGQYGHSGAAPTALCFVHEQVRGARPAVRENLSRCILQLCM